MHVEVTVSCHCALDCIEMLLLLLSDNDVQTISYPSKEVLFLPHLVVCFSLFVGLQ